MLFPRYKFELLRDTADGGGGGGADFTPEDPNAALKAQNEALAAQVSRLATDLAQINSSRTADNQRAQIEAAQARVDHAVTEASSAVDAAERALAAAFEEGDPAKTARAQRVLSEATAKHERTRADAEAFKRQRAENERRAQQQPVAPAADTKNLDAWKDRNREWYGIDAEMTRISHEIDRGIRSAGTYAVGSEQYFQAIDRAMKQRFPDRFAGAPASQSARADGGNNGQPPARRYSPSIQRGMGAFGMTAEQWDAARAKAVEKGLLSTTPATGRVFE